MSLAIEFPDASRVCEFLEWMAHAQVGHAWQDEEDRIFVETNVTKVPGSGGRTIARRSHRIWIWLPSATEDSPVLMRVLGQLGVEAHPNLPKDIPRPKQ